GLVSVGAALLWIFRSSLKLRPWIVKYWTEIVLAMYAAVYLTAAMKGNLDLGIRHILPIYIPLFILVGVALVRLWRSRWPIRGAKPVAVSLAGLLLVWYGLA